MTTTSTLAFALLPALALTAGCVDEHHARVVAPHHDEHYEEHHDDHHYYPQTVVVPPRVASPPTSVEALPRPPPIKPAGPGHWVWDAQSSQYVWARP